MVFFGFGLLMFTIKTGVTVLKPLHHLTGRKKNGCVNDTAYNLCGSGELLGVDYLLSQTGQPLVVDPDSEETENMLEDVDEGGYEEDEGFDEDQTFDVTLSSLSDEPSFSVSSRFLSSSESLSSLAAASTTLAVDSMPQSGTSASTDESAAVGNSGVPGMDRVDSLAEYLVLSGPHQPAGKQCGHALAEPAGLRQAASGVCCRTPEQGGHREVQVAQKEAGVHSRGGKCEEARVLATTAPLAQWPDCCRLIESIFVRLCALHRRPMKKGNGTVSRWDLIPEDYMKIRRCILANANVMQQTALQLVDVSHTTLVQWHNKRVRTVQS
ncbi:uncharacterized protein LOC130550451 [Triplophysa rosa]|uniref:uncharacterized protein LOC130550451 n=1 Tax=Triplophysa rosa TaxID=992332 RepID=UPI002546112F|nr:uncharacterized protein LOC130550451 [Triplophysa rosa]